MKHKVLTAAAPLAALIGAAYWATPERELGVQAPAVSTDPAPYPFDLMRRAAALRTPAVTEGTANELPPGLCWQDGAEEPDIGDPAARKGGRVRLCSAGPFPANFLAFGGPSPQFFYYNMFTMVELAPVMQHPVTGRPIPGTAKRWAVQGKTVFFELDEEARYSNGRPVRAHDYVLGLVLRAERGEKTTRLATLRVLGERLLVVELQSTTPEPVLTAAAELHAAEPGFYAEFGSDYPQRYARRIPPTTGGYTVGEVQRGRSIALQRVPHWWARNKRFYRYTCNVDTVEYLFPTDATQTLEFFLRGKTDLLQTRHLPTWRQLNEAAEVNPDIRCVRFRADYPTPPYGIAVNARTVPDLRVRRGLMQAMDMDRAVRLLFCGEGERLTTFTTGYPGSPTDTPQYRFDPAAARAYFAEAGYTVTGSDGILMTPEGKRLSFTFIYVPSDKVSTLVNVLVQSAQACGAEIVPRAVSWQENADALKEGTQQLTFWATMPGVPAPDYARFFSPQAAGHDAPFGVDDEELNAAVAQAEAAADPEQAAAAYRRVDRRVQELAIWLPGWKENLVLVAHRARVRFPSFFSTPAPYEVADAHLFWVQEEKP